MINMQETAFYFSQCFTINIPAVIREDSVLKWGYSHTLEYSEAAVSLRSKLFQCLGVLSDYGFHTTGATK